MDGMPGGVETFSLEISVPQDGIERLLKGAHERGLTPEEYLGELIHEQSGVELRFTDLSLDEAEERGDGRDA